LSETDTAGGIDRGGLVRAGLVVTGLYLVSRLLGWVRLAVFAAAFGAGRELDTFYAAFRLPDLMFQLVAAGALGAALIPTIAALLASGDRDRAWRVTSSVTNVMLVALLVLGIAFEISAPLVIPIITPGFSAAELSQTVDLTRIMLLSPILLALGNVATCALNAQDRFGAAALAPLVYNLGIIAGAIFLAAPFGVTGLAIGVVAGSAGHLLVQLRPLLRTGFSYRPRIDAADPQARQTLLLLVPRTFSLGANQLVFIVVTSIASTLGAGAITALNFAYTVMLIPIGVLGVPLGAVVFPSLARTHATSSAADYVRLLSRATRVLLFVMIPVTGLAIVLRSQLVTVLFAYGRFEAASVELVATTLGFFLLGLAGQAAPHVLARAFFARQDTLTPVAVAALTVVVNSGLAVALAGPYGLSGIALSFTIAAWLETLVLLAILGRRLPGLDLAAIGRLGAAAAVATAAASLAAAIVLGWLEGLVPGTGQLASLGQAIPAAVAFGAVFVALAAAFRIAEVRIVASSMLAAFGRRPA
jgi:putative peptidoglycan lipid II flippase